ncbi:MAG TPA: MBL fold metallo-hydrolase [bacterium]|nr:MBL fold metallo-hydrolase [bacterium]HPS28670.1 MBL fold metallo-hydrolase [bacterium]
MQVIFNGTGSSTGVPQLFCECPVCRSHDPKNARTRFSMTLKKDSTILQVDLPFELRIQLLRSGVKHVDGVWLTHPHSDHIAGIDDIRMASFISGTPIPLFAGEQTILNAQKRFPYMFFENEYVERPFLSPVILNERTIIFKDFEMIPLLHFHGNMEVYSFRSGNFGFLADISSISTHELSKLKGVHVLAVATTVHRVHERHMNFDQVIELIKDIRPEKAFLTHMNHSFDYNTMLKKLPDYIFPAYDGLTIDL